MKASSGTITRLLNKRKHGERDGDSEVARLLYDNLHGLARAFMKRERSNHTLQPSALLNEAYVHLAEQRNKTWVNRAHFLSVAAQVMRRVLVDHARSRRARKRGLGEELLPLDEALIYLNARSETLLSLDQALSRLDRWDARQARIVELRFFGGLTEPEIAELLGLSERTVKRDWAMAKKWLYCELKSSQNDSGTLGETQRIP